MTPTTTPQPGSRWRRALIGLAVVSALTVVTGWGAWILAVHQAEERVVREAAARGWQLTWREASPSTSPSLRLSDVHAVGPGGSTVRVSTLGVQWRWGDLLDGRRAPHLVFVDGLVADLDAEAIRQSRQGAAGAGAEGQGAASQRIPATSLVMRDADLNLRHLPGRAEPVHLQGLALRGGREGRAWVARYRTRCAGGCGPARHIEGELRAAPTGLSATASLDRPMPVEAPVPGRPEPLTLHLKRLDVQAQAGADEVRVGVGQLRLPLREGDVEVELAAPRAEVRLSRAGSPTLRGVALIEPEVVVHLPEVDPAKEDAAAAVHAVRHGEEGSPTAPPQLARRLPAPATLSAALERVLPRLERLSIEGGRLRVPTRGIGAEDIHTAFDDGVHRISARALGGRVALEMDEDTDHVTVELERVRARHLLDRARPGLSEHVGGQVSGRLALSWAEGGQGRGGVYAAKGNLEVEGGRLAVDGLSARPIAGQRLWLDLDVAYRLAAGEAPDRLDVRKLSLGLPSRRGGDPVWMHVKANASRVLSPGRVAFDGSLQVDPVSCDRAVAAIPEAMLPRLAGQLRLEGRFSPRVAVGADMEDPHSLKLDVDGLPGSCRVASLGEHSPSWLAEDFSHELTEGVSREGLHVGPGTSSYAPLARVPDYVEAAMYLTEEIGFYKNSGFGVGLIRRALILNLDAGRYVYGGSTVSQQLVKNLFLTRDKTLSRKLEEAFIVWKMEELVDKERILELYINCIEFGPDVYGIRRAARYYFDKEPSALTPLEGAYIAGLKPAPWNGEDFKEEGHTPARGWWLKRHSRIMKRLYVFGHITEDQYREAFPFVVTFPGYEGPPFVLEDRAKMARWGVEHPDDVIAEGRADWAPAPTPTNTVEGGTEGAKPQVRQAEPAAATPSPVKEGQRWMKLGELPTEE